jgi:hypothetical protein
MKIPYIQLNINKNFENKTEKFNDISKIFQHMQER